MDSSGLGVSDFIWAQVENQMNIIFCLSKMDELMDYNSGPRWPRIIFGWQLSLAQSAWAGQRAKFKCFLMLEETGDL